jgi:hypothetical protein
MDRLINLISQSRALVKSDNTGCESLAAVLAKIFCMVSLIKIIEGTFHKDSKPLKEMY